jgi:sucrose-6-phosphate hydrolase SacC (GH32 family)
LFKDNLYERLNIVSLVIVQDIVNKKIINKRMHLSIYVIDVNEVVLEARSYITKDIKIDIILDNDVLEMFKNKISLHLHNKRMQINNVQVSIKFILSKASSISFHVIFIIVFIILKSYLKTTNK